MLEFDPGSVHSATVTFSNPKSAGFDYGASLCMGAGWTEMATASFHLNAGQSKAVPFQVTMPATLGTYPVYFKVYCGGVLIGTFVATEDVVIIAPVVAVEVSRVTFDGIETPSLIIKRESYNQGTYSNPKFPTDQKFSFNINYKNNGSFPLWLHPYFAFGTWVGGVFIPYSPQRDLITYIGKPYVFDDDWLRLGPGNSEDYKVGKNMVIDFPDDNLWTSRAYLKVPAGGSKSTGFDNVLVGHNARSIVAPYPPIPSKEYLVLQTTVLGETLYYKPREVFEALDLDIAIKSKVYECEYYETWKGEARSRLVDTGIEVLGGLLDCAQIAHAWGSWSKYHSGRYTYHTWVTMLGKDIPTNAWPWSW